jgi:hypothetical protein
MTGGDRIGASGEARCCQKCDGSSRQGDPIPPVFDLESFLGSGGGALRGGSKTGVWAVKAEGYRSTYLLVTGCDLLIHESREE